MQIYTNNVRIVIRRLQELKYSEECIRRYERFYEKLRIYLELNGPGYCPEKGKEYIAEIESKHINANLYMEKSAIAKINDVYETGTISGEHFSVMFITRSVMLSRSYLELTEEYLGYVKDRYTENQLYNIRRRCYKFLKFMLSRGKDTPSGFGYKDLYEFHQSMSHLKRASRIVEESSVRGFLAYLETQGMTGWGLSMYLGVMESGHNEIYDCIPEGFHEIYLLDSTRDTELTVGEYMAVIEIIFKILSDSGYTEGSLGIMYRASRHLLLFLDINNLKYRPETAKKWISAETTGEHLAQSQIMALKRLIFLIEMYQADGTVDAGRTCPKGISGLDVLPGWCTLPLELFMGELRNEKLEETTVSNYIYSCIRFCRYIVSGGLSGFDEVDADMITGFNLYDRHGSSEGKNSCNSRIKKFLRYLYREGYTETPNLWDALGTSWAADEKNIIILSDGETSKLRDYVRNSHTPLELRNSAMILLGTEMGIRGCDIIRLKFRDIDWKKQTIRFVQDKTETDIILPMPASVGNALYRYISNARPKNAAGDYIFIRHDAPYGRVTRHACYQAIRQALPERNVAGSGFHVTRKTFATGRLKDNVSPVMISEILGHRDAGNISPYLSLAPEKMRLCTLSLDMLGIAPEGGVQEW